MGGIWIWYTGIHRGSAQTALSSQACLKYSQNFEILGTQAYTEVVPKQPCLPKVVWSSLKILKFFSYRVQFPVFWSRN